MTCPDLKAISDALETAATILTEAAVVEMRGFGFTDDEPERIAAGIEALRKLDPDPRTMVGRLENEKKLAVAGRAVGLADSLLQRIGFQEVKGAAWCDHDQQVIAAGLAAFDRMTAYRRG